MPTLTAPARTATLSPLPGESQLAFVARIWKQLPGETDQHKAKLCREAWLRAGHDVHLQRIAHKRFPAEEYALVTGSCVFKAHRADREVEAPGGAGTVVETTVYDGPALADLCANCNARIVETGDFAPLTAGHTPTREALAQGAQQPEVLGYAGPFYLGMLGGKFAIYCDEHHERTEESRLRKLQRRSPEVWLADRMEDRFFDPIACLGAETPRLDLGMTRYGRTFAAIGEDGSQLMKYAAPAAHSVFVPALDADASDRKQAHAAYQAQNPGDSSMIDQNDIQQIVAAVSNMELLKKFEQLEPHLDELLAMAGGGAPATAPAPGATGSAPPAEPPAATPEYEPDDEDRQLFSRYMAGECDEQEVTEYMAGKRARYMEEEPADPPPAAVPAPAPGVAPYSRRAAGATNGDVERYRRENDALRRELEQSRTERQVLERYSRLNEARFTYAFDVDEQLDVVRDMTDAQFEKYMQSTLTRFEAIPLASQVGTLPTPAIMKGRAKQTEDYQKRRAEEIQRRVLAKRSAGESVTYDAEAALFDKEQGA